MGRLLRDIEILNTMIAGMLGGAPTLLWVAVFFFFLLYVCALVARSFFGTGEDPDLQEMFSDVFESYVTTFRCSLATAPREEEHLYFPVWAAISAQALV